jgi:hypothetical protein
MYPFNPEQSKPFVLNQPVLEVSTLIEVRNQLRYSAEVEVIYLREEQVHCTPLLLCLLIRLGKLLVLSA